MASLASVTPGSSYPGLIKTIENSALTTCTQLSDGDGNALPITISPTNCGVSLGSANNAVTGIFSSVLGGISNCSTGSYSTVISGQGNINLARHSSVVGGISNGIYGGCRNVIGGGSNS